MKRYTEEFKKQAVELAESLGNRRKAAEQLGIASSCLYTWQMKFGTLKKFSKVKEISFDETEELKRLRRENGELKKINHILKSAAAFFSQDHLK